MRTKYASPVRHFKHPILVLSHFQGKRTAATSKSGHWLAFCFHCLIIKIRHFPDNHPQHTLLRVIHSRPREKRMNSRPAYKLGNPYYIYAPNYRDTSKASVALHQLCHALNSAGHAAYLAFGTLTNPKLLTPLLTEDIIRQHTERHYVPIAVYPDANGGNPLSSPVVARYCIESHQVIASRSFAPRAGDLFFHADEQVRAEGCDSLLLAPSMPDSQLQGFVALTQQAAKAYKDPGAGRALQNWLQARCLSPVQKTLLNEHRKTLKVPFSVTAIVLHPGPDSNPLTATLDSLMAWQSPAITLKQIVISHTPRPENSAAPISWFDYPSELAPLLNQLIDAQVGDWFILLNAGDTLLSNGTLMLEQQLMTGRDSRMLYCDEVHRNGEHLSTAFRPDMNLDYLLSLPSAMSGHWLFRRQEVLKVQGFDSAYPNALEFDLILRLIENGGTQNIQHLNEPLLICDTPLAHDNQDQVQALERHLKARGYPDSQVLQSPPGHYHALYRHREEPLVSILIPTKDQLAMVQRCVESVLEKTRYQHYEIILIDNNSETPEALQWLALLDEIGGQKVRVLRYPHPFNYSAINNLAAREARGEYLVLLNNDTAVIAEDWLDALLNHAQRPEVGIVGAKLLFPNERIQHAGVVLGLRNPAEHLFLGLPLQTTGYMQRLLVDQNYSAVTAACLMIRTSIYHEVGGLDEVRFKVSYNDVDLCLKVNALGYLNVWTPHALLLHESSVSQRLVDTTAQAVRAERFRSEQFAMYTKWLPVMAQDPAYNRNLSLSGEDFDTDLASSLTWQPLTWRPLPVVLATAADTAESGHVRIIQPFELLRDAGVLEGHVVESLPHLAEFTRYNPDVIVMQRAIDHDRLSAMQRMKVFSNAFKVFELDDNLLELPVDHPYRKFQPEDAQETLRLALQFVDRVLVSTPALANLLGDRHSHIQVLENRLLAAAWSQLSSRRQRGQKPRVGWAMDMDLSAFEGVVKAFAEDVEWVFIGSISEHFRPYATQFSRRTSPYLYPSTLAALDLDLALVPMTQSPFNDCKSHLPLLEYGACGIPVICSDVPAYQGDLPVTRVKNTISDWTDAIRAHLDDPALSARLGDALRAHVLDKWMLDAQSVSAWRDAWLP
jgi:O-antigen biosynthesis protein